MAPLEIVYYPDPILRRAAPPVAGIDEALEERVRQMFEVMYNERGVGLAAPQVGWSTRLFVMNPTGEPDEDDEEAVFINPEILATEGEDRDEEGCLSIPNVHGKVVRSTWIRVRRQNLAGDVLEEEYEGLPARVVQHELDHLDGVLFIQKLGPTDRLLIKRALKKLEKEYKARGAS